MLIISFSMLVLFSFTRGADQTHECPAEWFYGCDSRALLTCRIDKKSLKKCSHQKDETIFKLNNTAKCKIDDYRNCLVSPLSEKPLEACWCEQTDSEYLFRFDFVVDKFRDAGKWRCEKNCFDAGGISNPLVKEEAGKCTLSPADMKQKLDCPGSAHPKTVVPEPIDSYEQDMLFQCPKVWLTGCGAYVLLICRLKKESFKEKCDDKSPRTHFKLDNTVTCLVNDTVHGCVPSSETSYPERRCWCEETEKEKIFKMRFIVDEITSIGEWFCDQECLVDVRVVSPLSIEISEPCKERNYDIYECPVPNKGGGTGAGGGSGVIIGVVICVVLLIAAAVGVFLFLRSRKPKQPDQTVAVDSEMKATPSGAAMAPSDAAMPNQSEGGTSNQSGAGTKNQSVSQAGKSDVKTSGSSSTDKEDDDEDPSEPQDS